MLFQRLGAGTWVPDFIVPDSSGFQPLTGPGSGALLTRLATWDSRQPDALADLMLLMIDR